MHAPELHDDDEEMFTRSGTHLHLLLFFLLLKLMQERICHTEQRTGLERAIPVFV